MLPVNAEFFLYLFPPKNGFHFNFNDCCLVLAYFRSVKLSVDEAIYFACKKTKVK